MIERLPAVFFIDGNCLEALLLAQVAAFLMGALNWDVFALVQRVGMMSMRWQEKVDEMAQAPLTVLVPGFGDRKESLQHLEQYLQQSIGPTVTLSPQPSNGSARIEELARILALQIHRMSSRLVGNKTEQAPPLNLVGFSMGGLICRYYVQFLAKEDQVKRLVTIATPHYGTWSAYAFNCPACMQMRPGSKFLCELNEDLTALTTMQFVSMWSPFDVTILPAMSSWLPVGEIVTVASPLHQTMNVDPRVFHAVSVHLAH